MREKIKQRLVHEFMKQPEILGFYEGGSAAFNRNDEWSDLDLQVVVKDDFVEQTVKILEQTLEKIAPIEDRYILPAPTWHGHWQGFYKLVGVSPYLLIDFLIMKESSPSYFTEVELHGNPVIFYDKTGRLGKEHINSEELSRTIPKRIKRAENISKMMHLLVDKEIKRNRIMDAFELYYNLLFRTLVELLRIKYDRARWSFGPRYLSHDLPEQEYNRLKDLSYVKNVDDLQNKKEKVISAINILLEEIKSDSSVKSTA